MKKDIDWLNNELEKVIKDVESDDISFAGKKDYDEGYIDGIRDTQSIVNQLDEPEAPEVLSQEWIDDNSVYASSDGVTEEYVHVDDLQNLLVPKQELPVIPKFVAEWIESRKNNYPFDVIGAYIRMNELSANEQTREVLSWVHESELNRGSFARAWLDGFTVETEQKYYVMNNDNRMMLVRMMDGKTITESDPFMLEDMYEGEKESHRLTEQEIKDYDPRYWAFAKPVEELE